MPILPSATPGPLPTPADACPECVVNVETPRSVVEYAGSIGATYLCSDCGHGWTTSWKD